MKPLQAWLVLLWAALCAAVTLGAPGEVLARVAACGVGLSFGGLAAEVLRL